MKSFVLHIVFVKQQRNLKKCVYSLYSYITHFAPVFRRKVDQYDLLVKMSYRGVMREAITCEKSFLN